MRAAGAHFNQVLAIARDHIANTDANLQVSRLGLADIYAYRDRAETELRLGKPRDADRIRAEFRSRPNRASGALICKANPSQRSTLKSP